MTSLFVFLTLLMGYGHINFPHSSLNWWMAIFACLTMVTLIMWSMEAYESWSMDKTIAKPMIWDLSITCGLIWAYINFIL